MKTHDGKLTISRMHGDADYIEVRVLENNSQIEFVTAKISFEDFAKAVTGQGHIDVELELRGLDLVGWTAENKTELVPHYGRHIYGDKKRASFERAALAPFEVDGWYARGGDFWNPHNNAGDNQRVTFFRHVPPTEKP